LAERSLSGTAIDASIYWASKETFAAQRKEWDSGSSISPA